MAEQIYTGGYSGKNSGDDRETAKILKEALIIVDGLAKFDLDGLLRHNEGMEELDDLINKSKKLKKHRLWKLK